MRLSGGMFLAWLGILLTAGALGGIKAIIIVGVLGFILTFF